MGRKKRHEDHINHEAWAIPYGDLVTLLLAFFVVMYSISSVNEGKYRVLSESLVAAFRGTPKTTRPIQIGDKRPLGAAEQGLNDDLPQGSVDRSTLTLPQDAGGLAGMIERGAARAALEEKAEEIRAALAELIELDQVRVRATDLWLEVEIKTDLLFSVGVADVAEEALPTLRELADILRPMPNPLRIEGHTDNVPISTARFPSNWELSAARASRVVRLFQEAGVAPGRMVVAGLGEHQPIADNDSVAGRNRNRRVTVVILADEGVPEQLTEAAVSAEASS